MGVYNYLTDMSETDPNGRLSAAATQITISGLTTGEDARFHRDEGAGGIGDGEWTVDVRASATSGTPYFTVWCISTVLADGEGMGAGRYVRIVWADDGGDVLMLNYWDSGSGTFDEDSFAISSDTWYYLTITISGTAVTCRVYDDPDRQPGDLLATMSITFDSAYTFRYVYGVQSHDWGGGDTCDGFVANLTGPEIEEDAGSTAGPIVRPISDPIANPVL